ncbi:MAG: hypothetical protein PUD33_05315 [Treponema sp.]|nr:hypothetical protein [Treponema sp.]
MPLSTFSRAGLEEGVTYLTKTRTAYIGNRSSIFCGLVKFVSRK